MSWQVIPPGVDPDYPDGALIGDFLADAEQLSLPDPEEEQGR